VIGEYILGVGFGVRLVGGRFCGMDLYISMALWCISIVGFRTRGVNMPDEESGLDIGHVPKYR
jgi:hypothetical protein